MLSLKNDICLPLNRMALIKVFFDVKWDKFTFYSIKTGFIPEIYILVNLIWVEITYVQIEIQLI